VLRALPAGDDIWKPYDEHNENVKTFAKITKHLEVEDECLKACAPPPVALVARANRLRTTSLNEGRRRVFILRRNLVLEVVLLRSSQKPRARWRKIWHV